MSKPVEFAKASFTDESRPKRPKVQVHFNPASLQITLANTLQEKGKGTDKKQYVSKSSAKLSMELVFDTTGVGTDVRDETAKVAAFMEPVGRSPKKKVPPRVLFEWGSFSFKGIVEQYQETLDFFSTGGIPLRASVSLSLSRLDVLFADDGEGPKKDAKVVVSGDLSDVAKRAGNPRRTKEIAAANGLDSLRFPKGSFTVDASISLGAAASFSAGASASLGGSLEAGAAGSLSSGGGPRFGGSSSAGVSASAGAFAGLRSGSRGPLGPPLDPERLLPEVTTPSVAMGSDFGPGGRVASSESGSLRADVGGSNGSRIRIQFEEE